MARSLKLLFCAASLLLFFSLVASYEVPILDTDYSRQICSGMWSNQHTFINGTRSIIALDTLLRSGQSASTVHRKGNWQWLSTSGRIINTLGR
jgi:hypothetical protein